MSYLYSKLPETGVPPHIGTGGSQPRDDRQDEHDHEEELDHPWLQPGGGA